jgi:type II secretory pathway component PulJ
MTIEINHPQQTRKVVLKRKPKGFTLVELLVSMTITLIIVGLLMAMTKMAIGAWQKTHAKTRSSKLAQEVFDSIGKDLEGMVVRTGNNYEWLLIKESPDVVGERGPTAAKEMVNPLDITFFSAVTDRYDGQINTASDKGGDISTVRYRLIHQDLIGGSVLKPVFALYRERVNPDETFTDYLAKPSIDGVRPSDEIVAEENFLAENIFDFTLNFNFEYTATTSAGVSTKNYIRVVIKNNVANAGISIKGNEIRVNGASIQNILTVPAGGSVSSARLAGVDVSILVLSDGGMNGLQNANITTDAQFTEYLKEHGHLYSKSVIIPRP